MVDMSYDKGIVLCEQYWGSMTEEKFAQKVQSTLPLALDKSINLLEWRILMDGYPARTQKLLQKQCKTLML